MQVGGLGGFQVSFRDEICKVFFGLAVMVTTATLEDQR